DAGIDHLKPDTVAFTDHRAGDDADPAAGLMSFEDWARNAPLEKQYLSLYPGYTEPTVNAAVDGVTKPVKERLSMYVAQARFIVAKPPQAIDLARLASIASLEKLDPSIKEQALAPADVTAGPNGSPGRPWCGRGALCIKSRYQLEGKLPTGIRLVN